MANRPEALSLRLSDADQNLIVLRASCLKEWLRKGEGGRRVRVLDEASLNHKEKSRKGHINLSLIHI